MDWSRCRLWDVPFEMTSKLSSLPYPRRIVSEIQVSPEYCIDRRKGVHHGCQISCTVGGEGIFRIKKQEIRMKPGMAFVHCHGDKNNAYYYPPDGKEPWRFIWMDFYSKSAESMVRALNREYGYIFNLPQDSGIIKKLQSYKMFNGRVQVISPLEGATLFMDVITRLTNVEARKEESVASELIRLAHEYIYDHLEENINIQDIAGHLGISREHLARVFREKLRESPSDYLHRKKMARASNLLLDTNLTVSEIADKMGYSTSAAFIRTFKGLLHMTPGQFRENGWIPPGIF